MCYSRCHKQSVKEQQLDLYHFYCVVVLAESRPVFRDPKSVCLNAISVPFGEGLCSRIAPPKWPSDMLRMPQSLRPSALKSDLLETKTNLEYRSAPLPGCRVVKILKADRSTWKRPDLNPLKLVRM